MQSARWRLAFAATDSSDVNEAVARDAAAAGILCCRCDLPHGGDFFGAAAWQQDGITVAVSTAASSPALAGRVRDAIGASLDPIYTQWTKVLRTHGKEGGQAFFEQSLAVAMAASSREVSPHAS
jgi:precorrin-2 dehydrogenase/sirohydrochlorin ferrochelatase